MATRKIEVKYCNYCEVPGMTIASMLIRDYNDANALRVFFETIDKITTKGDNPLPENETLLITISGLIDHHVCLSCAKNKLEIINKKNNAEKI
jgi:hypothetical protein